MILGQLYFFGATYGEGHPNIWRRNIASKQNAADVWLRDDKILPSAFPKNWLNRIVGGGVAVGIQGAALPRTTANLPKKDELVGFSKLQREQRVKRCFERQRARITGLLFRTHCRKLSVAN